MKKLIILSVILILNTYCIAFPGISVSIVNDENYNVGDSVFYSVNVSNNLELNTVYNINIDLFEFCENPIPGYTFETIFIDSIQPCNNIQKSAIPFVAPPFNPHFCFDLNAEIIYNNEVMNVDGEYKDVIEIQNVANAEFEIEPLINYSDIYFGDPFYYQFTYTNTGVYNLYDIVFKVESSNEANIFVDDLANIFNPISNPLLPGESIIYTTFIYPDEEIEAILFSASSSIDGPLQNDGTAFQMLNYFEEVVEIFSFESGIVANFNIVTDTINNFSYEDSIWVNAEIINISPFQIDSIYCKNIPHSEQPNQINELTNFNQLLIDPTQGVALLQGDTLNFGFWFLPMLTSKKFQAQINYREVAAEEVIDLKQNDFNINHPQFIQFEIDYFPEDAFNLCSGQSFQTDLMSITNLTDINLTDVSITFYDDCGELCSAELVVYPDVLLNNFLNLIEGCNQLNDVNGNISYTITGTPIDENDELLTEYTFIDEGNPLPNINWTDTLGYALTSEFLIPNGLNIMQEAPIRIEFLNTGCTNLHNINITSNSLQDYYTLDTTINIYPDFLLPGESFIDTILLPIASISDMLNADSVFLVNNTITGDNLNNVNNASIITSIAFTASFYSDDTYGLSNCEDPIFLDLCGNQNCSLDNIIAPITASSNSTIAMQNSIVMPIELISYEADKLQSFNLLKWETATEIENDYFILNKSTNGKTFEQIAIIEGNGTSSIGHHYNFKDYSINNQLVYYQLLQIDFDGSVNEIGIKSIKRNYTHSISVYPNPSSDFIKINGMENSGNYISIFSVDGKPYITNWENLGNKPIDVSKYPTGTYILFIKNNFNEFVDKFSFIKN